MKISKREMLGGVVGTTVAAAGAGRAVAQAMPAIAPGPFQPTTTSLSAYDTPAWFRDAKFGIWAHWGPQAVPGQGDWYARFMYTPGHPHYDHHVKTYGHPSEKGYKDIIPLWTADKFDPEALVARYRAAGARYIVSMGVHHDNFDLWRSRHHRWNATVMGPKRDIVGELQAAAKRHGLRFGVSEHLGASYTWWYPNHLYDQFWPKLGVSYDGADPRYADLYHDNRDEPFINTPASWYTRNAAYQAHWLKRIRDLIDSYKPDLLYSDGGLPFGDIGRQMLAHYYNGGSKRGTVDVVYTCKNLGSGEFSDAWSTQDVERGALTGINPKPWQTDTSNGDWFYKQDDTYKTAAQVIATLADIVSKNGNLLLNVVLLGDGSLPPQSEQLLDDLAAWMTVNGEAIHGTRPWTRFGEGPTQGTEGAFSEKADYVDGDIRFTTRGKTLYAITLTEPKTRLVVTALRSGADGRSDTVRAVRLLGHKGALSYRQTAEGLVVDLPATLPSRHASVVAMTLA